MNTGLIERLKTAVEGECDGMAITDAQAEAILQHVGVGAAQEPVIEREMFERLANPDHVQKRKDAAGGYTDRGMAAAFSGWLARSKLNVSSATQPAAEAVKQRDELLAALEMMVYMVGKNAPLLCGRVYERAESTIARVKAQLQNPDCNAD